MRRTSEFSGSGEEPSVAGEKREPGDEPVPVAEAVDEAEAPDSPEEQMRRQEMELKKRNWIGTEKIDHNKYSALSRAIDMTKRGWDLKLEMGQCRIFDEAHGATLVDSVRTRPPTAPIRVTVCDRVVDHKYYAMSGQHIAKAGCKLRHERETAGLKLENWHRCVIADIFSPDCPFRECRIVSGSQNTSSRIQRTTSVSECVRMILRLEADAMESLSDRILLTVEQCGVNAHGTTLVCVFKQ